ncbi:hypothetical protein BU17DRAFT_72124 [Hysterangium stoloniferum]|nr:hypothetical protein BU17DRAFT_72124 [Hysterangium stoloniferum]
MWSFVLNENPVLANTSLLKACCNASTYKLDQLARKQHWINNFSTTFVEIDIVADFERTSLGLERLGERESRTTSSDTEPINNAMDVKSATNTVDGGCTKSVEKKGKAHRW